MDNKKDNIIEPSSPQGKNSIPKNILHFENLISGFLTALIDSPEEELENELNACLKKFVEIFKVDRCIVTEYLGDLNQKRKELEERLEFEELVSEFSSELININPDEIENLLKNWLEKFVELLDVDRGVVNEYVNEQQNVQTLIQYTVPGLNVPSESKRKTLNGVIGELEKGIIKAAKVPDDLPQMFHRSYVEKHNTKSLIVVPLLTGGNVFGSLSFINYRKERSWPDDLARRVKLIGEITGNAILRMRSHETLLKEKESRKVIEERYALVLGNANVGFLMSDSTTKILDVNDEYCRMSGYSRDEILSMEISDIVIPMEPEAENLFIKKIKSTGSAHHEATHRKKDGSVMDLNVSSAVLEGKNILFSFIRDITDLNQKRKEQEERLGFEELVSEFSAALINIKPDDLNKELKKWTIKFVDFLEIGRGVINEYQYDKNTIKALVSYTDPAAIVDTSPHDMDLKTPDKVMAEFKRGTTIRAEKVPEDLQTPFQGWIIEEHNTKSIVVVPLVAGNQVIGNLTLASYRKERKWPDDIFKRIKLIGEIIANAILRKRASDDLIKEMERRQRLEEKYTSIIKTANVGFWISDFNSRILEVNDAYCKMSGYSRDELTSMMIGQIDASLDPEVLTQEMHGILEKGDYHIETSHIKKDGTIIEVAVNSTLLEKEEVIFSFTRDITELNRARRELEELLEFEALISEFSAALINIKIEDIKTELNIWLTRFAQLLNVDRCVIGEYANDFSIYRFLCTYSNPDLDPLPPPFPSEIQNNSEYGLEKYLLKGESIKLESADEKLPDDLKKWEQVLRKDGTKSVLMLPLIAGDVLLGSLVIATQTMERKWKPELVRMLRLVAEIFANSLMREKSDVELDNYRKHLEKMVEERTARLEDAQKKLVISEKMATLGKLTATVSHELRNPLGTIRASVFSVRRRLKEPDEKLVNALDRAERNIKRCDLIIDELLNYSRTSVLNLEPTAIDSWINEVFEEMNPPEGIIVERQLKAGVTVAMDQERFRRSIVNILTNAYQAIQEKNDDKGGCVNVRTYQDNNSIIIDISDNGVGFDMANKSKLFEPLYSTKTFGIGLGIPITLQIIEQHGWNMEITGKPQVGTSVIITIPVITK